jgi:ribosomal-protein-alanine N-acetyltransferase
MITKLKEKRLGNISLREIEEADYLDYFLIGKYLETVKYLNWGPFIKPAEALYTIKEIFNNRPINDDLPKGYAITMDNHMIGMIDYHSENLKENSIEIGYFLKREYWGKGIMRKCVSYMVDLAFSLGFSKVYVGSIIDNLRSIHLIESIGFHYEYERVEDIGDGKLHLARYYAKYNYEE